MTIPISLVCFCTSLSPATGRVPTLRQAQDRLFLGVADLGLMTDGAHDVGLTARLINRIFHGFTVNSKTFVVLSVCFMLLM